MVGVKLDQSLSGVTQLSPLLLAGSCSQELQPGIGPRHSDVQYRHLQCQAKDLVLWSLGREFSWEHSLHRLEILDRMNFLYLFRPIIHIILVFKFIGTDLCTILLWFTKAILFQRSHPVFYFLFWIFLLLSFMLISLSNGLTHWLLFVSSRCFLTYE